MTPNDRTALKFESRDAMNWSVILAVTLGILVVGRNFLMPLAVAVLLWSLLNAFSNYISSVSGSGGSTRRRGSRPR